MEFNVVTLGGDISGTINVSEAIFARPYNEDLIHQAVTAYLSAGRQGTRGQKKRSDVRGGGKKPWKQKGSGRARAGSSRSPIWRSGGVTFAARTQDHSQKLNKKMYRAAMRCILSELSRQGRLQIVDAIDVETPKTKHLLQIIAPLVGKSLLILSDNVSENLYLSSRNIPNLAVMDVVAADPVSLVGFERVLITASALRIFDEVLS